MYTVASSRSSTSALHPVPADMAFSPELQLTVTPRVTQSVFGVGLSADDPGTTTEPCRTVTLLTAPAGPAGPPGPAGPAGPCGPTGPAGSWPGAKSERRSERFATLAEFTALFRSFAFVTALGLSWSVPTLFRGSALIAATLVPVSATRSAMQATTIAGEGRQRKMLRMSAP